MKITKSKKSSKSLNFRAKNEKYNRKSSESLNFRAKIPLNSVPVVETAWFGVAAAVFAAGFAGLFAAIDVAGSERMSAVPGCAAQDFAVGPHCAARPPIAAG